MVWYDMMAARRSAEGGREEWEHGVKRGKGEAAGRRDREKGGKGDASLLYSIQTDRPGDNGQILG